MAEEAPKEVIIMASIVKRRNRFYVVYQYTTDKGERKQKWETYKTMTEAKTRQKEIEYRESIGTFVIPQCHTVKELMKEYVSLYGKETWALSTYSANVGIINNYILPLIGDMKLTEVTPRVLEKYYQQLLKMKPVPNSNGGKTKNELIGTGTVREIHKIIRNCFNQAVKWELVERNPAVLAIVPKHKAEKRDIWTAETLFKATELCKDERLKLALNLAFSCSLRLGELVGLTWDCVDIDEEAIAKGKASILVNKELQRVRRDVLESLDQKDVILIFPSENSKTKTVQVLKAPKTQSSIRRIFLPKTVAGMLIHWRSLQDEAKDMLGDEYQDFNLVLAGPNGMPTEGSTIRSAFDELIKENDLPKVVFHSLRHSSITYKLKLNGGDVKAVQGDSGHAQTSMVTDVYSHILDDDRRHNAELFEEAFYAGKGSEPAKKQKELPGTPGGDGMAMLGKLLSNPDTAKLLKSLMAAMETDQSE